MPRDYRKEYLRRVARGLGRGLSRSQARGHPKPAEATVSTKRPPAKLDDARLQRGLRVLRKEGSLAAAARAARISPERLKHSATSRGAITKEGRRWIVRPDLSRRMLLYSRGRELTLTVGDFARASQVGRYLSAVAKFLKTNNPNSLTPFVGQSVTDIAGKRHPFETNPNVLYRLSFAGGETFEQVYRVVV